MNPLWRTRLMKLVKKPMKKPASPRGGERGSVLMGCSIGCAVVLTLILIVVVVFTLWLKASGKIPPAMAFLRKDSKAYLISKAGPADAGVLALLDKLGAEIEERNKALAEKDPADFLDLLSTWNPVPAVKKFMPLQVVVSESPVDQESVCTVVVSIQRGRGGFSLCDRMLHGIAQNEKSGLRSSSYRGEEIFTATFPAEEKGAEGEESWYFTVVDTTLIAAPVERAVENAIDAMQAPPAEYPGPPELKESLTAWQEGFQAVGAALGDSALARHWLGIDSAPQVKSQPAVLGSKDVLAWKVKILSADSMQVDLAASCRNEADAAKFQAFITRMLEEKHKAGRVKDDKTTRQGKAVTARFTVIGIESMIEELFKREPDEQRAAPAETGADNRPEAKPGRTEAKPTGTH